MRGAGGIALGEVRRRLESFTPYLPSGNIRHYDRVLHYLLNRHPPGRDGRPRLLELGSRHGLFLDFLAASGYTDAVGIDMDGDCVALARKRGLDVRLVKASQLGRRLGRFDAAFALRFFPVELKFQGSAQRRAGILATFAGVHACLEPGGTFFCDAEGPLPVAGIEALGVRIESSLRRTKIHPMIKSRARDDVWVFEKNADRRG